MKSKLKLWLKAPNGKIGDLNERVTEIRTLIFGINDRINLLMRHRHDNLGRVYLVPEETPAD